MSTQGRGQTSSQDRGSGPAAPMHSGRVLAYAALVTLIVTLVSRFAPKSFAATGVGLTFLASTWFLTIRKDESDASIWGLSLGGILDRDKISVHRLMKDAASALLWTLLLALIFYPPFYFGYRYFWQPRHGFALRLPPSIVDDIAGQLFVIALPEEAFFRGYLQSALDQCWPRKVRVFGADLGAGWLVSAAIFAVGHLLTTPVPARLAVFFPALVFGYLRARTKGIGAGVVFHAACNLFSATLGRSFGLPL